MPDHLRHVSIARRLRLRLRPWTVAFCAAGLAAAGVLCMVAYGHSEGAFSQTLPRANAVASLAATCAGCHGSDGAGTPESAIPPIASLPPEKFVEQMRAFRDGEGKPTVMRQIAAGYDAAQTRALADYFAGMAKR